MDDGWIDPVVERITTLQWLDQSYAWFRDKIRTHGWAVQAVCGDDDSKDPGFAYTVGLSGFDHPELVVFGLRPRHAIQVLNELGEQVRAGAILLDGDEAWAQVINPHQLRLFTWPNPTDVLFVAQNLYGTPATPVAALQVVWADLNGTFPWEPTFRNPQWLQPMPGQYTARG